jgi:hypothetical protein
MLHDHLKAVAVPDEVVFRRTIVVPENLFVQIAKQMERLDVWHTGSGLHENQRP